MKYSMKRLMSLSMCVVLVGPILGPHYCAEDKKGDMVDALDAKIVLVPKQSPIEGHLLVEVHLTNQSKYSLELVCCAPVRKRNSGPVAISPIVFCWMAKSGEVLCKELTVLPSIVSVKGKTTERLCFLVRKPPEEGEYTLSASLDSVQGTYNDIREANFKCESVVDLREKEESQTPNK